MSARFFVDRPIFATVLAIAIVVIGVVALVRLPIAQYPEVVPPTVSVTANYPGANALDVAETVAAPIEQEVNGVENMIYMFSRCTNDGQMILDVTFKPGTNLDMAQVLVQNRVSIATAKLPDEVKRQGVTTKKKSPSILLCVNLISAKEKDPKTGKERFKYDQLYLNNYAMINIKDVLARVAGVGDVVFLGPRDYSMRIWLDPDKVASVGMTASEVVQALREQNRQVAAGRIGQPPVPAGQDFQYPVNIQGRLGLEQQFADVIVKTGKQGRIVYLKDVVTERDEVSDTGEKKKKPNIELGAKNYDVNSYLDGQPSVTLAAFQLPGSNALETAKNIRKEMDRLKGEFPSGIEYQIVYDTTVFIDESIHEVYKTLFEAFALVFVVVLVFLGDWRATLLPMIVVPVSLIGTFVVMAMLGFSLNNLSLFGLVLAIGIVVDDAILVVENVERWMAKGLSPREATIKAMAEITGPVIAVTLVLSSVFIPTAFLAGITGQFYRQFALTIAASTIISAINAMTLAPARAVTLIKPHSQEHGHGVREVLPPLGIAVLAGLAAYFYLTATVLAWFGLSAPGHGHEAEPGQVASPLVLWAVRLTLFALGGVAGWFLAKPVNFVLGQFLKGFNWLFERVTNVYGMLLSGALRFSVVVLIIYGGLLCLTVYLFQSIPQGFIPEQDKGYLVVNIQLAEGASLERTDEVVAGLTEMALHGAGFKDAVEHTIGLPGYSILTGTNISNVGGIFVILKSFEERKGRPELYAATVGKRLQQAFREKVLSAQVAVFGAPPIDGLGSTGGFKLMVQDRSAAGPRQLQGAVGALAVAGMAQKDRFAGLFSSYSANQPQVFARVDKEMAKARGVSLTELYDTLGVYFGSAYVNDFTRFGRNWQVIVQADPRFRAQVRDLGNLKVRNKDGHMVAVETFIADESSTGPAIVNRFNMYPSGELNGITMPGTSSADAIAIMDALVKTKLPTGFGREWTDLSYQEIVAAQDPLSPFIFPLCVLFVFLVLSAQYESWYLPLAILLIVPMCVMSGMIGVWLVGLDNNIFTQIGLIVLIGLAAKNAIVVVEFAKQREDEGVSCFDATLEASKVRLRPILMTSFAFILGVLPLVLSAGAGAEMRVALGVAVFSGMLGVTFFGLFLTPVFYLVVRWLTSRAK